MVSGAGKLWAIMKNRNPSAYTSLDMFQVRCISHVVNLAVKEYMRIGHGPIPKIGAVLNSLRASLKRKDDFLSVRKELNMSGLLHTLDCETRWSSNFIMVSQAYAARKVLNATV